MSLIVLTPKRTILGRKHVIWAIKHEYRPGGLSWACEEEKKGQDRKKVTKGYISPIWGEAPTEAIYIKNCVASDILDVITCAKFQSEIFRGYDFIGGQIFHFPIDFWMGLTTVQRYCAACDLYKPGGWLLQCICVFVPSVKTVTRRELLVGRQTFKTLSGDAGWSNWLTKHRWGRISLLLDLYFVTNMPLLANFWFRCLCEHCCKDAIWFIDWLIVIHIVKIVTVENAHCVSQGLRKWVSVLSK